MRFCRFLVAPALLAVSVAGSAHHSPVMFDTAKTIELNGTVREFQWTNPHCYIQLMVEKDGQPVEWNLEMGAPIYLANRGWRPSTIKAGQQVRITANPLRSGANGGLVIGVASADGKKIGR